MPFLPNGSAPVKLGLPPIAVPQHQLPGLLGVSRRTLSRLRATGEFPEPDRVVGRIALWRLETLTAWLRPSTLNLGA